MFSKIKKRVSAILDYFSLVRKISGKNKLVDMLLSRAFLGIPYELYFDYSLYNKSWKQKKDYVIDQICYSTLYNGGTDADTEIDKTEIVNKTKEYFHRKIVFTKGLSKDDFVNFTQGLDSFFYKPINGSGGIGIEKIYLKENDSLDKLYYRLIKLQEGVLEETIKQNRELDKLCPNLLQTIRFQVFKHKYGTKILYASIKSSVNKTAYVDNMSAGGIYANINLDSGIIQTNAYRSITSPNDINLFDQRLFSDEGLAVHPITGVEFKGFQIPYFDEAKKMVIDITNNVDFFNRRFLAYDIAITNDGPVLVEANITVPGFSGLWQTSRKDVGLKPVIEYFLNE